MVFFDALEDCVSVPKPATPKEYRRSGTCDMEERLSSSCVFGERDLWCELKSQTMEEYEVHNKPPPGSKYPSLAVGRMLNFVSDSEDRHVGSYHKPVRKRPLERDDCEEGYNREKKYLQTDCSPVKMPCRYTETQRRFSCSAFRNTDMKARRSHGQHRSLGDASFQMPRICMIPVVPMPVPQFCFFDFCSGMTFQKFFFFPHRIILSICMALQGQHLVLFLFFL